jgi:hypothetical protein
VNNGQFAGNPGKRPHEHAEPAIGAMNILARFSRIELGQDKSTHQGLAAPIDCQGSII